MHTWTLTPDEYDATAHHINKINTRATKRGFTGRITLTATRQERTTTDPTTGLTTTTVTYNTTIDGNAPSYNGWTFIAAIDTLPTNKGNSTNFVLRAAPGVDETTIDRTNLVAGRCQHCNITRANRKYTYLVHNTDTGATLQVGSTCIKDFLGWTGNPVFFSADAVKDDIDGVLDGWTGTPAYTPATVIAVAYACVKANGWTPASAYASPTRAQVDDALNGTPKVRAVAMEAIAPYIADGEKYAATIIDTIVGEFTKPHGYEANLVAVLTADHITESQFGLAASAIVAYERILGFRASREVEAAERATKNAELAEKAARVEYAGTVGDKIQVEGTITRHLEIDGDFGPRLQVIVENATTVAIMYTTAKWAYGVRHGDVVTVVGTVKRHREFNGIPQTEMTRVKQLAA